jgi:valyl-tRNA synthetase
MSGFCTTQVWVIHVWLSGETIYPPSSSQWFIRFHSFLEEARYFVNFEDQTAELLGCAYKDRIACLYS